LYIHIGVTYTGLFTEGTAAKMSSKLIYMAHVIIIGEPFDPVSPPPRAY